MIQNLQAKIDKVFDDALLKYAGKLPFGGKYLKEVRDYVDENFDRLVAFLRAHSASGGDYDLAVDMLVKWLKNYVPMPGYLFFLSPFKDMLLDQLDVYLKANRDLFADDLIAMGGK